MSRTEIAGMLSRSDCQFAPSSNDTQTCASVAAYRSPRTRGSSRIELATALGAIPALISVHVLPPSCVRQKCGRMSSIRSVFAAAYAVSVSKWPASILKMRVHGLMSAGVAFFHVVPPFSVTWMLPSSVPAHRTALLRGDGDSAVIVPRGVWTDSCPGVRVIDRLPHDVGCVVQHARIHRRPDERHRAHIAAKAVAALRDIGTDRCRLARAPIVARHVGARAAEHDIGIARIGRGDAVLLN